MGLSSPSVCFSADVLGEQPFRMPVGWAYGRGAGAFAEQNDL